MTTEPTLTRKRFDSLARELFGSVLEPRGFSCESSASCTFPRKISAEVHHVILPDPFRRISYYDINMFPTSPRLQEDFADRAAEVQLQARVKHAEKLREDRIAPANTQGGAFSGFDPHP